MDTLDITPFEGRPINDALLESINPTGICLYVNIRSVADMVDVMLKNFGCSI